MAENKSYTISDSNLRPSEKQENGMQGSIKIGAGEKKLTDVTISMINHG